jgi:hypothetical protein
VTTRRLTAVAAALAVLAACAPAAAAPYGPLDHVTPIPAPRGGIVAQPPTYAPGFVPGQYTPLQLDQSPHAGFPATVRLPDGQVRIAWRESSGHLADDGRTLTAVGDPITGVWSTPAELVLDTTQPGRDMRPAALSYVDGKVRLTYFFWEGGVPAGAYMATSEDGGDTFGGSVRVDGGRPYAAVGGPMVKAGAKWIIPWYGRNAGDPIDTVWIATSTDSGATWAQLRIANGLSSGWATTEPWALVRGNTLMVLYRDGIWSGLAMRVSPDGGTTWQAPVRILNNATANSASVWTSNGNIYLVYRHTATRDAMLAVSKDSGATWQTVGTLMRAPANLGSGSLGMTYAAPVDLGDGLVWCPIGMEQSLDASRIYVGWL